jgi:hypothetical protein
VCKRVYAQARSLCAYAPLRVAVPLLTPSGKALSRRAVLRALISFFLLSSPVFVSMATFAVYSLDAELTPQVIFPALAYFNLLRFPLTFMPVLIIGAHRSQSQRESVCVCASKEISIPICAHVSTRMFD